MLYIIDDKVERQQILAPNLTNSEDVKLIHTFNGELDNQSKKMFEIADIIAIHDSFFKNPINKHPTKTEDAIRRDLKMYCIEHNKKLIFFSGDYNGYNQFDNGMLCMVSVTRFYKNLNFFLASMRNGTSNLEIVGYGKNFIIEEALSVYNQIVSQCLLEIDIDDALLLKLCKMLGLDGFIKIKSLLKDKNLKQFINEIDPALISCYENNSN